MNKIKETYLSPTTETLVVRFEGSLLTLSNEGKGGIYNIGVDDVNDDDDAYNG